ncbi:DNA topoisomerase III [uncultured Tyzzerella sp.]|uniref:DNA topoisomerase III n=1 Tax=uncultured Tyzzerella sp. TaxID=2321398 RepID=UPI002941C06E|nr:DNA topoisomerase III [uncultured Tyzzerella sp.]
MNCLVIAEKPSVARDIAKVLNCTKKGDGYFYNDKYIISWAIGHLVTLYEPEEYDETLKKWDMSTLPIIPDKLKLKSIKNTRQQFKVLKTLINSKNVTELICATDSGREGELIFRYIYELTKCKKPFKRLWISSMTYEAIKEGFENLKDSKEYDNLYLSAKCRSEADWLVGINASRAFTIKFHSLLSIGRVQTPTLAIIVERYKEIENFNVQEYFEIEAHFKTLDENSQFYKGIWIDNKNETKILDKAKATNILNYIKNKNGIVNNIEKETKKQPPPLLYDLTELQRDCNKKFSYSAQKTLSIAQDLYEKRKLITYPRTDSRYLSKDMASKLKPILQVLKNTDHYNHFLEYVLSLDNLPITNRIIDDNKVTDHHAIIPTLQNINISSLSKDEFNVYDLIVRRFIAVFYPAYVYSITKITTKIDNHLFLTKGTTIINEGFTKLNIKTEKDKKEEIILPNVEIGKEVFNEKSNILTKKTTPPKPYNEATLLSAMENAGRFIENEELKENLKESGLGTPATRASIIERLIKVGYVQRKGKSLIPTQKGVKLIEIVPKELKSPETTGKWEKGLSSISKGSMQPKMFMDSIGRYVNFIVDYAKKSNDNIIFDEKKYSDYKKSDKYKSLEKFGLCPKCNNDILENSKAFYCSNWKSGCKFTIWKNHLEKYNIFIHKEIAKSIIQDKKITNKKIIDPKDKKEKLADLILLDNGNINIIIKS